MVVTMVTEASRTESRQQIATLSVATAVEAQSAEETDSASSGWSSGSSFHSPRTLVRSAVKFIFENVFVCSFLQHGVNMDEHSRQFDRVH